MIKVRNSKKSKTVQIVNSAATLFYKQGFEKTTFAQIANEVGVSQPAIYSHFKNKMDLLKSVVIHSVEAGRAFIEERLQRETRIEAKLSAYSEANLDFFRLHKVDAHSLMALYFFGLSSDELMPLFKLVEKQGIERIQNFVVLTAYANQQKFENLPEVACAIHSLLIGDCYKVVYASSPSEFRRIKEIHHRALASLMVANIKKDESPEDA